MMRDDKGASKDILFFKVNRPAQAMTAIIV
jgi:hypothetical protein